MRFVWVPIILWMGFVSLEKGWSQDLTRYEVALNQMRLLEATFFEQNSQGQQATGTLYMVRPEPGTGHPFGNLKLDYDPPKQMEILANGTHLMLRENFSEEAQGTPIEATPVAFLLRPTIAFKQDVIIQAIRRDKTHTAITVCQAKNPDAGSLTLVFEENPVRLKRWVVTDPQGVQTQVTLTKISINQKIPRHKLQWKNPK